MVVDREGILKNLINTKCIACDPHNLRYLGLREKGGNCKLLKRKCAFTFYSKDKVNKSPVSISSFGGGGAFKPYGIENPYALGKDKIFYFLYYPELKFETPPIPTMDRFGKLLIDVKKLEWQLHHLDGNHWNDNIWNLFLVLNTEHVRIDYSRNISLNALNEWSSKALCNE